jgi:glutamate synthase domain-containing protein 3
VGTTHHQRTKIIKRVINGISLFWLTKANCLVCDRDLPAAIVVTPEISTMITNNAVVSVSGNTMLTTTTSGRELALENAAHSINVAVKGLLNTLKET